MYIFLSRATKNIVFEKVLNEKNDNNSFKEMIQLDEQGVKSLIAALDSLVQDYEIEKISKRG